jgi:hypothetical protein
MANKISFPHSKEWGVISPDGDYDLPVKSVLGHRFKLVDGAVEDRYNGVTDKKVKNIDTQRASEIETANLELAKQDLVIRIKKEAAVRIAATDWKVERAKERDALKGTNTLQDIYAERELIRGLSDEAEVAVLLLETLKEVFAFFW